MGGVYRLSYSFVIQIRRARVGRFPLLRRWLPEGTFELLDQIDHDYPQC